jgi:hypothetical protein
MGTKVLTKHTPLTRDEKEAAEAAFQGAPFKARWSKAARAIYDGIVAAMVRRDRRHLFGSHADHPSV